MRRLLAALILATFMATPVLAQRTLTVATGGAFSSIDPHYFNLGPNNIISYHLFDALTELDANYRPVPGLAESWTAVDEKIWEFKLRPNVRFSDGTPFTPDDVVFSFERIPTVLNSPSSFNQAVKPIARIEIVDPLTIRMHTQVAEPLLPYYMAQPRIVSRKHGTGASTSDYNSGKAAIGTGPYLLDSVALGDKLVFKRNPTHWGPAPHWDTVVYRLIANGASRTAALQAGDVDIIDQVSTKDVSTLKANPALTVSAPPGQRLIYVYVDTERATTPFAFDLQGKPLAANPLKDLRVRRALSLAINREGVRTQIMDGYAAPTGQIMPEGGVGYVDTLKPDPFDAAQARKLLAEAGFPNGFALTLHGPNDRYVNDRGLVEAIAQMWTRVGVKTTVNTMPTTTFFPAGNRDEFSINLIGWASDTGEASSNIGQLLASPNPDKGRGAILKPSHFARETIDQMFEHSMTVFDPAKREALYRDTIVAAMAELPLIPIHFQVNVWAMKKTVALRPRMQEGIRSWEVDPVP